MTEEVHRDKPKLLVLVGPTAVGKTELSLQLAKTWHAEIISGDSMQVYRGMDIGTAKASSEQLESIPHHLIDILDPDEPFSVSDFQRLCRQAEQQIRMKGKLPFIVGGTGLYIQSVIYDYEFHEGGADEAFRLEMKQFAEQHGVQALHDRLREVDPKSAERLHPNDTRRVIRALEIARQTGATMTEQLSRQTRTSPYELCIIGLTMERTLLYERIEKRVDMMLEQGLVEEVQQLLAAGYHESLISMQGLGYKEIVLYLRGQLSLEEAVALIKRDTRRFAKRQLSWFRRMPEINWVDVTDANNYRHLIIINDIIAGKFPVHTEYTWKQC